MFCSRMPKISAHHCRSQAVISIWQKPMMAAFTCHVQAKISFFLHRGYAARISLKMLGLRRLALFDLAAKNRLPSRGQTQAANAFASGIKSAVWPGRVQPLNDGLLAELWPHRPIWLDGAHNAHGARALAKTLGQIDGGKWNIICGALNTRDPAEFLAPLAALAGSVRCLAIPDQPASLSAADMTAAALAQGLDAAASNKHHNRI